jgi:hypothetical protein
LTDLRKIATVGKQKGNRFSEWGERELRPAFRIQICGPATTGLTAIHVLI